MAVTRKQARLDAYVTVKDLHLFQKVMMDQFQVMDERFNQRLLDQEKRLHGALEQYGHDLKRDIRDEMGAKLNALEGRLVERMDHMRAGLVSEITDMFGDRIVPQIDELYDEVGRIKKHVGMI